MSLFPFWYSQISLPIQYTHKKQVLVWNTTQLFDKKHCTLSLMAIWVTILFQKKAVSIHLGKLLHLRCTSGNQCSWFRQLQVPDEHSIHPLCLGPFAFLMGLLRLWHPCHSVLPKYSNKQRWDCMMATFCRREPKKAASWSSFFKWREKLICETCPFSISCCLPVCLEGKTYCGCASN